MYIEYYRNIRTGELKRIGSPKDAPSGFDGWVRIQEDAFHAFELTATFYKKG
jgi:hypothetical protein